MKPLRFVQMFSLHRRVSTAASRGTPAEGLCGDDMARSHLPIWSCDQLPQGISQSSFGDGVSAMLAPGYRDSMLIPQGAIRILQLL